MEPTIGDMTATAGWYPDPRGVSREQWYWDGITWVSRMPELSTDDCGMILSEAVAKAVHRGWRVESQTMYQATLVSGSPCNHVAWLLAGLFTCGIAWIGWLLSAALQHETRTTLRVTSDGQVVWG